MEHQNMDNIPRLGPRIPVHAVAARGRMLGRMEAIMNTRVTLSMPDHVLEARSATTTTSSSTATGSCGASACQMPVSSSTFTLPVVLGVV